MWLWWIGNTVLLLAVVPVVLLLANRVMRPALEVQRYAEDILEHGAGLSKNLEPLPAVAQTGELVSTTKHLAVRYVDASKALL